MGSDLKKNTFSRKMGVQKSYGVYIYMIYFLTLTRQQQ